MFSFLAVTTSQLQDAGQQGVSSGVPLGVSVSTPSRAQLATRTWPHSVWVDLDLVLRCEFRESLGLGHGLPGAAGSSRLLPCFPGALTQPSWQHQRQRWRRSCGKHSPRHCTRAALGSAGLARHGRCEEGAVREGRCRLSPPSEGRRHFSSEARTSRSTVTSHPECLQVLNNTVCPAKQRT